MAADEKSSLLGSYLPKTLYASDKDQRIHTACFLIRDAVVGGIQNPTAGAYLPYEHPEATTVNSISVFCRRLCHEPNFHRILYATVWLLSFVTFVEPPQWCRSGPSYEDDNGLSATENCALLLSMKGPVATGDGGVDESLVTEYYPSFNSFLSVENCETLEWIFLAIITVFIILRIGRDGCSLKIYLRQCRAQYVRIIQIICIVLLAIGLILDNTSYSPFIRLLLLGTFVESVQQECRSMILMFSDIFSIFLFYFLVVAFYAGFGVVAFSGSPQGAEGFENFVEALWTLYICITTANYPDVMMPSFNSSRVSGIYFVSFMIISFFFFCNLITSRISNKYGAIEDDNAKEKEETMISKLKEAFFILDFEKKGEIAEETILKLFDVLNSDFPSIKKLDAANLRFLELDEDGSGTIDQDEFLQLNKALLGKFVKASEYTPAIEKYFPSLTNSSFYKTISQTISSAGFENFIDFILVLNGVAIIWQTYPILAGAEVPIEETDSNGKIDNWWELLEAIFAAIYFVEMMSKITVWGWKKYIEDQRNVFDFIVTVLSVVATIYVYTPNDFNDAGFLRMLVSLRMFRLIRLLASFTAFKNLTATIVRILPEYYHFLILYYFVFYFFVALGVLLYGGMISRNPKDDLAYMVLGTDFSDAEYWANNFNDAVSGFNVIFNLIVINNWTECEIGYEAVTQSKQCRWYFFAFYIVGVVFVQNIVLGWFIDNVHDKEIELEETQRSGSVSLREARVVKDKGGEDYFAVA